MTISEAINEYGLQTASDSIVAKKLNAMVVDGTVVAEEKRLLPKPEVLAVISDASLIKLLNFFDTATDQARAFKYRWDSLENLDLTHAVTRASIEALQTDGIFTAEEAAEVLGYGERNKTKADELIGRLITAEDVTEARNV